MVIIKFNLNKIKNIFLKLLSAFRHAAFDIYVESLFVTRHTVVALQIAVTSALEADGGSSICTFNTVFDRAENTSRFAAYSTCYSNSFKAGIALNVVALLD